MKKTRVRYAQILDGEWVRPTPQRGHKMACCDCGLIHRMDFRVRDGKVEFRPTRDARATAARRRRKDMRQRDDAQ